MLFGSPEQMMLWVIVVGPTLLFALWAQYMVKSTFNKYNRIGTSSGLTGAEAAARMLSSSGLEIVATPEEAAGRKNAVAVVGIGGFLSDHYDPSAKVLRLSPEVYSGRSISSVGVACHEAGHALQHATGYAPLSLRSAMVPMASFGSNLAMPLVLIGLILHMFFLAKLGLIFFAAAVVFTLVTLPVEFNASNRAKAAVASFGLIRTQEEQRGVASVLNAAALTYVAAAASAIANLLYLAMIVFGGGRRD